MSNIAIKIENLGKRYRYGEVISLSDSLRTDIMDWGKGLLRLREKKNPTSASHHESFHQVQAHRLDADSNYFWALRDINLEIKQGEIVGIIGRNGAGKSTLLKILSRISPPTTGTITYHGRVASLLEVGTGFHRELTGRENIFLNGSILGMRHAEISKSFDEIVAFAEVEKFIDTPVKFYSSGMYVRLAFAVAAHLQPEILIVDEVLAVGDFSFQRKCLGKMGEVARTGITVLFVSHNMSAIENLCNKSAVLSEGRLAFWGDTASAVSHYVNSTAQDAQADTDLTSHLGRTSNSKTILRRLRLLRPNGTPCASVRLGEELVLEFTLNSPESIRNASLEIGFNTGFGLRVLTHTTRFSGQAVDLEARKLAVIRCLIPEFLLSPGQYRLKLVLDRSSGESYDVINDAATLTVEAADFYGGGLLPSASQGLVVGKVHWVFPQDPVTSSGIEMITPQDAPPSFQKQDSHSAAPLVSIIIPTKNRCQLLQRTLASVRSQTYPHWEAIVVDDDSEDDTIRQMELLSREESRIRFLRRHEEPSGTNACRNLGLKIANGEYVIFLDSDDCLAPFCLKQRVDAMQHHPKLDFGVFPSYVFHEQPSDTPFLWNIDTEEDNIDRLLSLDVPWNITSPIWRRPALKIVGPCDVGLACGQDWIFHIRALTKRLSYQKFPGPDFFYRLPTPYSGSIGSNFNTPNYLRVQESLLPIAHEMLLNAGMFNETRKRLLAGLYFGLAMRWQCECESTSEALRVWRACRNSGLVGFKDHREGWLFLHAKDHYGLWRLRDYTGERFRAKYAAFRGSATIYKTPLTGKSKEHAFGS
jgi:lipopolysaccharide transport system ATP-binding protein